MRRNNIFMWAYIVFIFGCCFVRGIINFEMWNPIVLAVTISSALFAIEDLLSSISGTYKKTNIIREHCALEIRELLKIDMKSEKRIMEEYVKYKGESPEVERTVQHWKNLQEYNKEILGIVQTIESGCESGKRTYKRFYTSSLMVLFLGFLTLFVIMTFSSYFTVPIKFQEIITVFSFGIILFTQQMSDIACEKIRIQEEETEDVLRKYKSAVKETISTEEKVLNMIRTEQQEKETESL